MRRDWWIYAALLVAILAAYAQVLNFEFVNYDDPDYVTENPHVRAGLAAPDIEWAFTSTEHANWFPLTWLSHMLDVESYGLRSGPPHLTNVAIHAFTTLLLFALLLRITGQRWPSAFVAFIFAMHPLHVESVAWISERKDILSGFFFILALWAYVRYVERPSAWRYLAILLAFACGIMAKPMIVTLPFVMLLMDFWPLQRSSLKTIVEKLPLFGLSTAAAAVAYIAQQHGGAVSSLGESPFGLRLGNAAVSYVLYIVQFFWPAKLAVFYPFPDMIPTWEWIAAIVILAVITILAWRKTGVAVGWFWFLGTLIPVIGLVKIGLQARADRYTYIPLIGLSIAVAWGASSLVTRYRWLTIPIGAWACALCAVTFVQTDTWRNSLSLFEHAIAVTDGNYVAHNNLGIALRHAGRRVEAIPHFEEAIRLRPRFAEAQNNLGEVLLISGRADAALPHVLQAIQLDPRLAEAHINLGALRNQRGRPDLAESEYRTAVELKPLSAEAHDGLAVVLTESGRTAEALAQSLQAIALNPEDADSHYNLGRLYGLTGRTDEAIAQFRETVRLEPANAEAHFNLGTAFVAKEQLAPAIAEFRAAIRIKPGYVGAHFNLGSALARSEHFDEAIAEFSEVLRLDPSLTVARDAIEYCKSLQRR